MARELASLWRAGNGVGGNAEKLINNLPFAVYTASRFHGAAFDKRAGVLFLQRILPTMQAAWSYLP
jgi:hypothetical protein